MMCLESTQLLLSRYGIFLVLSSLLVIPSFFNNSLYCFKLCLDHRNIVENLIVNIFSNYFPRGSQTCSALLTFFVHTIGVWQNVIVITSDLNPLLLCVLNNVSQFHHLSCGNKTMSKTLKKNFNELCCQQSEYYMFWS